jgi:uncharacterized membrane protein
MLFGKPFFSDEEKKAIAKVIADAEEMTSGEIRVHIEPKCNKENVLDRATEVFYKLDMHKTAQANGVLIYVAYDDKRFAIIGDKGIDSVVPANFWDGIKEVMHLHFAQHEFYEGIVFAIKETGMHLKQYFPLLQNDTNELPNEVSEG